MARTRENGADGRIAKLLGDLCREYINATGGPVEELPEGNDAAAVEIVHRICISYSNLRKNPRPPPPAEYSAQVLRRRFSQSAGRDILEQALIAIDKCPLLNDKRSVCHFIALWTAALDHRFSSQPLPDSLPQQKRGTSHERPDTTTASSGLPSRFPSSTPSRPPRPRAATPTPQDRSLDVTVNLNHTTQIENINDQRRNSRSRTLLRPVPSTQQRVDVTQETVISPPTDGVIHKDSSQPVVNNINVKVVTPPVEVSANPVTRVNNVVSVGDVETPGDPLPAYRTSHDGPSKTTQQAEPSYHIDQTAQQHLQMVVPSTADIVQSQKPEDRHVVSRAPLRAPQHRRTGENNFISHPVPPDSTYTSSETDSGRSAPFERNSNPRAPIDREPMHVRAISGSRPMELNRRHGNKNRAVERDSDLSQDRQLHDHANRSIHNVRTGPERRLSANFPERIGPPVDSRELRRRFAAHKSHSSLDSSEDRVEIGQERSWGEPFPQGYPSRDIDAPRGAANPNGLTDETPVVLSSKNRNLRGVSQDPEGAFVNVGGTGPGHRTPLPMSKRATIPAGIRAHQRQDSLGDSERFRRSSSYSRPLVQVPTSQSDAMGSEPDGFKPRPGSVLRRARHGSKPPGEEVLRRDHHLPAEESVRREPASLYKSPPRSRITPVSNINRLPGYSNSPARSLYSVTSDWKHSAEGNLGGDLKRNWQRAQAAFSLYPTPGEVVALVRDVIYCLQGIDGQHLRYNPDFDRFMLPLDLPLARPIRVLAHRMVAPGNCFMRIHATTNCSINKSGERSELQPLTNLASMVGSHLRGYWTDSAGQRTLRAFETGTDSRYASEQLANHIPPPAPLLLTTHVNSLVVSAFLHCVRDMLGAYYHELGLVESELSSIGNPQRDEALLETFPAPRIVFSSRTLRKLIVRLRAILKRIHCVAIAVSLTAGQVGGELLTTLDELRKSGDPTKAATMHQLFEAAMVPMIDFVRDWTVEGKLDDQYSEWFVKQTASNSFYSSWRACQLIDWSLVPSFMTEDVATSILNVGKMAFFIRRIKGPAYFDDMRLEALQMSVAEGSPLNNRALCDVPCIGLRAPDEIRDSEGSAARTGEFNLEVVSQTLTELPYSQPIATVNGTHKSQQWPSPMFGGLLNQLTVYCRSHNSSIRRILLDECRLIDHLKAIRGFMLLGYGDFIDLLIEQSNELLVRYGTSETIVQSDIDYCVHKCIQTSTAKLMDEELRSHLKAITVCPEEQFGQSKWEYFTLDWKISDNPISVVLRDDLRFQYRRLFSMLWKVRRVTRLHQELWAAQMQNAFLLAFQEVVAVLMDVQALRNEIMHVVQCIEHYVFNDVIGPAYERMIETVKEGSWTDLDELIDMQEQFVNLLLLGCFLDEWPEPTRLKCLAFSYNKRQSAEATRADLDKSFLSMSCALPMIAAGTRKSASDTRQSTPRIARLIDSILETAAAFASLSDSVHMTAFQLVEVLIQRASSGNPADEDDREHLAETFINEFGDKLESARGDFTESVLELFATLSKMKEKYQSEAVAALILRLDFRGFYAKLQYEREGASPECSSDLELDAADIARSMGPSVPGDSSSWVQTFTSSENDTGESSGQDRLGAGSVDLLPITHVISDPH